MEENKEKVYWLVNSEEGKIYDTTTWYRSAGIEEFVEKVEADKKIVGIIFSGNNIGFLIDEDD